MLFQWKSHGKLEVQHFIQTSKQLAWFTLVFWSNLSALSECVQMTERNGEFPCLLFLIRKYILLVSLPQTVSFKFSFSPGLVEACLKLP